MRMAAIISATFLMVIGSSNARALDNATLQYARILRCQVAEAIGARKLPLKDGQYHISFTISPFGVTSIMHYDKVLEDTPGARRKMDQALARVNLPPPDGRPHPINSVVRVHYMRAPMPTELSPECRKLLTDEMKDYLRKDPTPEDVIRAVADIKNKELRSTGRNPSNSWDVEPSLSRYFTKAFVADRKLVLTGTSPWIDADDLTARQDAVGMSIIGVQSVRQTADDALLTVHYDDQDGQLKQWLPPSDALITFLFEDGAWKIDEITTVRKSDPTFSAHAFFKDLIQGVWYCGRNGNNVCGNPAWILERWENQKKNCDSGNREACDIDQQISDRFLSHHYCYGITQSSNQKPTWYLCDESLAGPKGEHYLVPTSTSPNSNSVDAIAAEKAQARRAGVADRMVEMQKRRTQAIQAAAKERAAEHADNAGAPPSALPSTLLSSKH